MFLVSLYIPTFFVTSTVFLYMYSCTCVLCPLYALLSDVFHYTYTYACMLFYFNVCLLLKYTCTCCIFLFCYLFLFIKQHYDDKVDLWSIGALLYKVLIGQCGFYAVSTLHYMYMYVHVHTVLVRCTCKLTLSQCGVEREWFTYCVCPYKLLLILCNNKTIIKLL